jgi:hypothetical protein
MLTLQRWFVMPKFAKTRISETLEFIDGYAASGLDGTCRGHICNLIKTRFPRTTNAQKTAYDNLSASMSVKGAIAVKASRGNVPEREMRRAIVLIWSALAATQNEPDRVTPRINAGMTLATGALPAALTEAMRKASVVAHAYGAADFFNNVFAVNIGNFISTNRIFVHGSTQGANRYQAGYAGSYQNVLTFLFYYCAQFDRFEFATSVPPMHGASHSLQVCSVPALHWSDVPGRGATPVPLAAGPTFAGTMGTELNGSDWMVTTQFTGCSFCYKVAGGTSYAAHLSPAGIAGKPVLSGNDLADQLMGNQANVVGGNFGNAAGPGQFHIFGNGNGNAGVLNGHAYYPAKGVAGPGGTMKYMTIVGRRNGGNWELYTQSMSTLDTIMEHRRFL